MKIEERDLPEVQRILKEQLAKGNRFYIHDTGRAVLTPAELIGHTYSDKGDARLYAHIFDKETKTDHVVLSIADLDQRLTRIMELRALSEPAGLRSGDVSIQEQLMVSQEKARQEIALSGMQREMEKRNFRPDRMQDLKDHIAMDTLRFTLPGMRQSGVDQYERYHLTIEQDRGRAFHITAFVRDLDLQLSELEVRMKELKPEYASRPQSMDIRAGSMEDRQEVSKAWKLIDDLHLLYLKGPHEQKGVKALVDKYWNEGPLKDAVDPLMVITKHRVPEERTLLMGKVLTDHGINVSSAVYYNEHVLSALAEGFYQKLPFNEKIIPNEHVDRFQVITQITKEGALLAHEMRPQDRFSHFEGAYHRLNDLHNVNWDREKQHLLVGIFKGQEIRYHNDNIFKAGTAILFMEAGWKPSGPDAVEPYINKVNDLYQPYTLRSETIARYDPETRALNFYDDNFQPLKYRTMNEKNEEYLQKQMKWVGFGDNLNEQLSAKLKEGAPEFVLTHNAKFGKDEVAAVLNFSKSKDSEMVFFNRYQVVMPVAGKDEAIKQTFYIHGKEDNITLKEAYNQLSGRAVYKEMSPKEGDKYMAWEQLDFKNTDKYGNFKTKQFNENYGYDLAATLAKYPIKELNYADSQERLMDGLQRGNRQQVTLAVEGKELKIMVEAAPQWKSLNFHNEEGKRLDINKVLDGMKPEQPAQNQAQSQSAQTQSTQTRSPQTQSASGQQQEQKNGTAQKSSPLDDEGAPASKQGRKKGMSM